MKSTLGSDNERNTGLFSCRCSGREWKIPAAVSSMRGEWAPACAREEDLVPKRCTENASAALRMQAEGAGRGQVQKLREE